MNFTEIYKTEPWYLMKLEIAKHMLTVYTKYNWKENLRQNST